MAETCLYFVSQGAARVYGFEIDVENYRMGLENVRLNNMADRVHIYNQLATYNSIKDLIYEHGLRNVLLKIDCEGCEYEILENADPLTFKNVNDIVLEYHGRPKPLIGRLTKLGYGIKLKRGMTFQPWGIVYATRGLASYCITWPNLYAFARDGDRVKSSELGFLDKNFLAGAWGFGEDVITYAEATFPLKIQNTTMVGNARINFVHSVMKDLKLTDGIKKYSYSRAAEV